MCKRYSGKGDILKIDFKHARGVFEEYLNGYDREDEKIKLKIIHTYGAVSYTHLDVYKRQVWDLRRFLCLCLEEVWENNHKKKHFRRISGAKMLPFL